MSLSIGLAILGGTALLAIAVLGIAAARMAALSDQASDRAHQARRALDDTIATLERQFEL